LYFKIKVAEKNKDTWVEKSMVMMSVSMLLNFMLFMAILERNILGCYFYKFTITSLTEGENDILTFLFLHILPIFILNYLLEKEVSQSPR